MSDLPERAVDSKFSAGLSTNSIDKGSVAIASQCDHTKKASLWSSLLASNFFIFESHTTTPSVEHKVNKSRNNGWVTTVKRIVNRGSMRRFQERILGTSRADLLNSTSEIWLLGTCYKVHPEESSAGANPNDLDAFLQDFSSRIWVTYRKGVVLVEEKLVLLIEHRYLKLFTFDRRKLLTMSFYTGFPSIIDSKFTSDVGWGCMIRSSQMLVAQALLFHRLGRAWRKPIQKPYNPEYIEILHLFGDFEACSLSIHNLLQAGRGYGLAAGSWLGPYAMCRAWETIAQSRRGHTEQDKGSETLPMAVYVVSGDEDGERGGAPVLCVDVAARLCSDFNCGKGAWVPILLLVPLVLGLEKVNPRYIPLLRDTFKFPQSLGILGGKPGASTYLVGVQDEKALYLDPHDVQLAVEIKRDDLEADTSSYHCSTVRSLPLDQIDPSLAIGFYCRDEDDFKDFCLRASELGERSCGAPLFTVVTQSLNKPNSSWLDKDGGSTMNETFDAGTNSNEDDWQLL